MSEVGEPVEVSGSRYVKPSNANNHGDYTFYVKVTAEGGASSYFGPYTLYVGCTSNSVSISDAGSFATTGVAKSVGDSTASVYTMVNPTINRAWCTVTSNEIVQSDGSTANSDLVACAS